jgi:hypothetical protein
MEEMGLASGLLPDWALSASSVHMTVSTEPLYEARPAKYRLASGGSMALPTRRSTGSTSTVAGDLPYQPAHEKAGAGDFATSPAQVDRDGSVQSSYGPSMARLYSTSGWRPAQDTMHEFLQVKIKVFGNLITNSVY